MKKILCTALMLMMLASMFAIPASAEQSNVEVNALKFTEKPSIDGVVSEDEWGAPTVRVNANEAATKEDAAEGVNEFNTYIEFEDEEVYENMYYDIWLRYDADNYYIAVKVHDVDGFAAPNQGGNIWNNDCVQLRVDPQGPISSMKADDPSFDYKTTAYDYAKYGFGGSNGITRAWANSAKLINAGFALVRGTTAQAYDMATDPGHVLDCEFEATCVEIGDQIDDFTVETTYEIAIPWGVIGDAVMGDGYKGAEGDVLGMTLVVLNSNGSDFNALLTWGSGITGGQGQTARQTAGGSNAVVLSADTVTPKAGYAVATEEVTETETEKADDPATEAPSDDAEDTAEADTKAPTKSATNYANAKTKSGGLSTGAIIGIIAGAVVVVAAVVILILKKKKK